MKLEAGKYYKTRGGDKAVVKYVCEDPPQEAKEDERTCFGFIWKDGGECFSDWSWVRSGEWIPWERNPEDLVSEWTEPVKCGPDVVYLLKYECKCSRNCSMSGHEFFASKEMADYFIRQKEDQYESVEYTLQAYRRSND